jgi:hypothetical protein
VHSNLARSFEIEGAEGCFHGVVSGAEEGCCMCSQDYNQGLLAIAQLATVPEPLDESS